MTVPRSRRLLPALVAVLALGVAACSDPVDEASNGAIASSGDVSDGAVGNVESQAGGESTPNADGQDAADLPAESETGVGDDPANGGAQTIADEPAPVIESEDGLSTEPVNGGAESAAGDTSLAGPAMAPSAAETCAVVEFGYLGLLDGDTGPDVQARLTEGATNAAASSDARYQAAGAALLDAVGSDAMSSRADELLAVCASDGFERLA
ncbi:MAG: hypothetical protein R2710_30410 [Acidimicrobiales bacterium]